MPRKPPTYRAERRQWLKNTGIKPGDRVILVADPTEWREGYGIGALGVPVGAIGTFRCVYDGTWEYDGEGIATQWDGKTRGSDTPFWCVIKA